MKNFLCGVSKNETKNSIVDSKGESTDRDGILNGAEDQTSTEQREDGERNTTVDELTERERHSYGVEKERKAELQQRKNNFEEAQVKERKEVPGKMGGGSLVGAVKNRDINLAKRLLEQGDNVNSCDCEGRSALDWAVIRCNVEFVKLLLDAGADVNLRGKGGKTPIHWAIRYAQEDRKILGLLKISGADLEVTNDATDNILHSAAYYGNVVGIDYALDNYIPLESTTAKYGYTPLLRAARGFADKTILDLLVFRGANLFVTRVEDGQTFLHCAAKGLNDEAVKWGLTKGVDPNQVSTIGTTPIQHMERWAEVKSQRDNEAFKNIKTLLMQATDADVSAIDVRAQSEASDTSADQLDDYMAGTLAEMEMSLLTIKEDSALTDSQFHKLLKCLVQKTNKGRKFSFDVFISHSWKGESLPVSKVVKEILEKDNLRVWYDEQNIQGDLNKAMVDGISNSAVFLLVSSQEYEESMNCMREMNYADRTKKPIVHVCTGYRTTGELDFVIGNLLYYELPRDRQSLLAKVKEEVAAAHATNPATISG